MPTHRSVDGKKQQNNCVGVFQHCQEGADHEIRKQPQAHSGTGFGWKLV